MTVHGLYVQMMDMWIYMALRITNFQFLVSSLLTSTDKLFAVGVPLSSLSTSTDKLFAVDVPLSSLSTKKRSYSFLLYDHIIQTFFYKSFKRLMTLSSPKTCIIEYKSGLSRRPVINTRNMVATSETVPLYETSGFLVISLAFFA